MEDEEDDDEKTTLPIKGEYNLVDDPAPFIKAFLHPSRWLGPPHGLRALGNEREFSKPTPVARFL